MMLEVSGSGVVRFGSGSVLTTFCFCIGVRLYKSYLSFGEF